MKTLKRNTYLFYIIEFLTACIFTTAIWTFFFTSYLTFSFSTALFITLLSGIISFVFEVPSGAWADKFGRKKMYFLGIFLIIISFSFWIFSESLYLYIISAILQGIGFAMISGNLEALIHDYLELKGKGEDFKDIQANAYISQFIGRAISSLLAGYLFVINPVFPAYATIFAYFIALILVYFFKDKGQKLDKTESTKSHMKNGFRFILGNSFLFYFVIIMSLFSAIGNIYWFTYQPYFKYIGINIENIGILFAISGIFSAIGAQIIKKLQDNFSEIQIVYISILLLFFSSIFLQFFNVYGAIFGLIIISIVFGFVMSFSNNVLIKEAPKKYKSTILSIFSLFMTIGYTSFSMIAGIILDYTSLNMLYGLNIFLILILLMFSLIKLKKH